MKTEMKEDNEDQIQIALQPAPMDRAPSEDLLRRLRVLAHETPQKSKLGWLKLAVPAGAAVAAASLIAVTTMMPAKASARTFDLIEEAAAQVNSFQFSVISNEQNKHEAFTIAGSDGHVYMRTGEGGLMEVTPGAMSIYDPTERTVTRIKFGTSMDAQEVAKQIQSGISQGLKEIDLKQMLKDYKTKYGSDGVQISPIAVEDGQRVYHVTLANKNEPERVEMTVDADSNLPAKLEVEQKDGASWKSNVKMEMRFGIRVDQGLLRADFPKDVKVEEIDLGSMIGGAMKGLEHLGDPTEKPGKK